MKEFYFKKGYFESQLTYRLVPVEGSKEVDVEINISEGRAGNVDDIVFTGFSKKEESAILEKLYTEKYAQVNECYSTFYKLSKRSMRENVTPTTSELPASWRFYLCRMPPIRTRQLINLGGEFRRLRKQLLAIRNNSRCRIGCSQGTRCFRHIYP